MNNKVLVVAAHPDDEVLGAGGAIINHVRDGDEVAILTMSDGETARSSGADVRKRQLQCQQVAKFLGCQRLILNHLPDQRFDTVPFLDITQKIEKIIYDDVRPDIVYTHCPYDLNMDHRIIYQAVLTACRPGPSLCVKKLLSFETLSSTEWQMKDQANAFSPTYYTDITEHIYGKIEAMNLYRDEIRKYPHPRSAEGILTLAKYRGMQVGFKYSEAFQAIRILNK
jgi:N-acetylglucosamine malate deacetylase 1